MNKVKVSREVAEAIERLRKNGHDNNSFIEGHVKYGYELDENKCLNELDTETLARALLIGYEVEETPEEEILEVYNFEYGAGWGGRLHGWRSLWNQKNIRCVWHQNQRSERWIPAP